MNTDHETNCLVCGITFAAKLATAKYCSGACQSKSRRAAIRQQGRNPNIVYSRLHECQLCGKTFPHQRKAPNKYCSRSCASKALTKEPQDPHTKIKVNQCPECSALFVTITGRYRKYCTTECKNIAVERNARQARQRMAERLMSLYYATKEQHKYKQSAFWRREIINYLADRDHNKCGICGRRVDRTLPSGPKGSELGPSIDHIIPRSQGGSDDLANLRLTHWRCNRKRRNKGGNEQLRLIG